MKLETARPIAVFFSHETVEIPQPTLKKFDYVAEFDECPCIWERDVKTI